MMTGLMLALMTALIGTGAYDTVLDDAGQILAFPEDHVLLIGCTICMNDSSPGMDGEFSQRTQGWSGCADGLNEPHFIFKTDVPNADCDAALQEVGAVAASQFPVPDAVERMNSGELSWADYLDGSRVMASIRWVDADGIVHESAYERFFEQVSTGRDGEEIVTEFLPHLVYHGSNQLNEEVNYGCLVCQQDCSGGLVCNNLGPCCRPVPMMRPLWDRIPEPGTPVTLVLYVMPER